MENVKIAVIGIGNMGSAHATCIAKGEIKGLILTAVCDININKLNDFKNSYPNIKTFENYSTLLNSNIADAVIIAVPHPLHAKIAISAFEHGLHVLLEKPADIKVSIVKKLNCIAHNSNKTFAIMFNQRTNPLFQKARDIVSSGKLGELKRGVWIITNWYRTQHYYDSSSWRATWSGEGGGVLLNQAPHNLDIFQWICGMPKSVIGFCECGKYHNIEVEDEATVILKYKNGAFGTFITSTGELPGTNRLEISGTLGKIILENGILKWWRLETNEREICNKSTESFLNAEAEYFEFSPEEPETAHKGILQNFANSILFGEALISPGVEGINELTISNAAYLSSWKNNSEIELPFDTDEFDQYLDQLAKSSKYNIKESNAKLSNNYSNRWKVNW